MRLSRGLFRAAAVVGATWLALPALAQEAAPAPPPAPTAEASDSSRGGIEEIIVTAERREQNLQDVAQTITAFTPQDLEAANIQDAYDLQMKVPGLVATGGLPAITLRGLGQDSDVLGPGIDPGFQLHINDIYVAQIAVALVGFMDLESIEVLPGPQGTGFGRNSTGGSMNLRTRRPDLESWEFGADLDISQWENFKVSAALNAPIIDGKLAARVAYRREIPSDYYEVRGQDGHRQNVSNNAFSGGHQLRTSFRWVPTETVTTDLIFAYSIDNDGGGISRMLSPYPTFQPGQSTIFFGGVDATTATPNDGDVDHPHQDLEHTQRYETFWGQAIVEWEIPKHVLKLNGNYQYFDYATDLDYDYTDIDAQELILKTKNKTWSGEATIRSEYEGRFDWLFGANYQKDNAPATDIPIWLRQAGQELQNFAVFDAFTLSAFSADAMNVCAGPCIFTQDDPNRPEIQYDTDTDTDTLGVFLQGGIDFTEQFRLDAGVRYSWTQRKIEDNGYIDILLEPYDVITDGFCPSIGFPTLGPFDLNPKENCFEILIAPGFLQPQVGAAGPLDASNVAFLFPLKGNLDPATLNVDPVVKDKEWDSITGRVRFEYRPTDGHLFYVGYSRGERHGGFNFFSVPAFKSETINAYEIGAKNTLFDSRLQLNSTFFYYDFKNRFINETVNNVVTTVNAPQSQIYGVELAWIYAPIDRLLLSGNFGYLHAEVTEDFFSQDNSVSISNPNSFCAGKVYPATPGSVFAGLPAVGDQHGYGPTCDGGALQNLKGNVLPRAPEFTISASAAYVVELASGTITPRIDFAYRSEVFYRQFENPLDRQGAYTRTDMRVRYDVASTPVWFELYVQNLEDNSKIKTQVDGHLNWPRSYWLASPRTFGARFGFTLSGDTAGELWPF